MQISMSYFLSVNVDVRSGRTTVRGATNCITASRFDAEICIKDNRYKIMRDNYRVPEVPVHAYIYASGRMSL